MQEASDEIFYNLRHKKVVYFIKFKPGKEMEGSAKEAKYMTFRLSIP